MEIQNFSNISQGKRKIVIFDRDGTLNKDSGYTYETTKFFWNQMGRNLLEISNLQPDFAIAIASNQSGIAKGLCTTLQVKTFNEYLVNEANRFNMRIDAIAFCPHDYNNSFECYYRKPNPGMLIYLMDRWGLAAANALFVGNSPSDENAALNAGVKYISVLNENAEQDLIEWIRFDY